ncbi:hypothetical protein ABMY26_06785 (plasmid) [Azospirillum sp. HJ39]|uniref:hypothetical protein n=1 Tax=Azospirillum sp. HJ39 TaxID=3159496 RepID=UPI0035581869
MDFLAFLPTLMLAVLVLYIWNWQTKGSPPGGNPFLPDNFNFGGSLVRTCATLILAGHVKAWHLVVKQIDGVLRGSKVNLSTIFGTWAFSALSLALFWIGLFTIAIFLENHFNNVKAKDANKRDFVLVVSNAVGVASFVLLHIWLGMLYKSVGGNGEGGE